MALFRMATVEGGSVIIDGTEISTLGLADLRERLAIIPQEPVMFQGTVRSNLDPFDQLEDEALWQALEVANLKESITKMPGGLNAIVHENGRNFSLGQR
jgi:ABC-type multidrug transport system fused ATPase/permease subunit